MNYKSLNIIVLILVGSIFFFSCKKTSQPAPTEAKASAPANEPQHIKVQHILIGFKDSIPGKKITRSLEDATKLAHQVFEQAKAPKANFDDLVKKYTDDRAPGIYGLANLNVAPNGDEFPRDQMVPAFGDVGFKLGVGEIGLAEFEKGKSPFGYHIIKRLN